MQGMQKVCQSHAKVEGVPTAIGFSVLGGMSSL